MPIYEYTCHDCGKVFDAMQKFSDAPLTQCRCGKAGRVSKNLTAAGFALKGTGWYVTDFKNGASTKPTETKTEATTAADSAATSSSNPPAPACGAGACAACS